MFKGLGNLFSMMKQAQQLSGQIGGLKEELQGQKVTGSAGGGLVQVEASGLGEVLNCKIDPSLFKEQDRELLEDMITAAVNQALMKAKQLHQDAMKKLASGMNLPGLDEALNKITQGDGAEENAE